MLSSASDPAHSFGQAGGRRLGGHTPLTSAIIGTGPLRAGPSRLALTRKSGPRHDRIAGRHVSRIGHGRLASITAFGLRPKTGVSGAFSRDLLSLALCSTVGWHAHAVLTLRLLGRTFDR